MNRRILGIAIGLALIFEAFVLMREFGNPDHRLPPTVTYREMVNTPVSTSTQDMLLSDHLVLPEKSDTATSTLNSPAPIILGAVNLKVPFRPQAPFADWSEPYENGCEEASLIMVDHYYRNTSLSRQEMKDQIDSQVAWQFEHFGGHFDLAVNQVRELSKAFYAYKSEIITDLTVQKIKDQLRLGRPVIVPSAGRELGNPNFTYPGPLYHMLVIKGYREDGTFITNDPGTRNGADYEYSPDVLMAAVRDWDGDSSDGPALGLVLYP